VKKIKTEEDKKMLQEDMDELNKWSEDWLLKFNVDKCKKMTIRKVPRLSDWSWSEQKNSTDSGGREGSGSV